MTGTYDDLAGRKARKWENTVGSPGPKGVWSVCEFLLFYDRGNYMNTYPPTKGTFSWTNPSFFK